jgi:tetratricopeptide (TPR) repeat protein
VAEIKGWDRESLRRLIDALFPEGEEDAHLRLTDVTDVDLAEAGAAYDEVFDEALAAVRKHQKGTRKWAEQYRRVYKLLGEPRPGSVARWWIYPEPVVIQVHLDLSFEARHKDPSQMLYHASRAKTIAFEALPERYPPGVIHDLRVRTFAELANSQRVNEFYGQAEASLGEARYWLDQSSGDPALLARVLDVEASLRSDQRQLEKAHQLLERAAKVYSSIGDAHSAGRTLIKRGSVAFFGGHPAEAACLIEEGLSLVDRAREPKLVQTSYLNLLDALTECGEYRRAGKLLLASGLREAFADEPLNLLRLRWVEAKIHAGLDRLEQAEALFLEIRAGFLSYGLDYDAALAGLDLARVWLRMDRASRVVPLAVEMIRTFDRLKIAQEGKMALRFLKVACEDQFLTVPVLDRTRDFIVRIKANPEMKFEAERVLMG